MPSKVFDNLRHYLEQPSQPGVIFKTPAVDYLGQAEIPATASSTVDNDSSAWRDLFFFDSEFEERSEAFDQVWSGIEAGHYKQTTTTSYISSLHDVGSIYLTKRLQPVQLFCESMLEQVGLSDIWSVEIVHQPVTTDTYSFLTYVVELIPTDSSLVIDHDILRCHPRLLFGFDQLSRSPYPTKGSRIPLLAVIATLEGSCPEELVNAETLIEMTTNSTHVDSKADHNVLRAVMETFRFARTCRIPRVWFGDSANIHLFDYSLCNLHSAKKDEVEGICNIVYADKNTAYLKIMAQDCLDAVLHLLPQWRIPYALWQTNEYAPYPVETYMQPSNADKCTECPRPIPTDIRAYSSKSCYYCGGWGYTWYNENKSRDELYWKPPTNGSYTLRWTCSNSPTYCQSPSLAGQTLDGCRAEPL